MPDDYTASEKAAVILTRTFEALARQLGKTLSAKTRADLTRACELLADGDNYDELLVDLLEQPRVTQSFERAPIPTEEEQLRRYSNWRYRREEETR